MLSVVLFCISLITSFSPSTELGFPSGFNGKKNQSANAGDSRVTGSIPGSGRCPGGGNGNPLQDTCLGNPMDRGAWQGYDSWGRKH